jgi:hypothetical protein
MLSGLPAQRPAPWWACRRPTHLPLPQHETSKGQLVHLLRVAGEPSVDLAVRQVASISFKQTAKRHWEPERPSELLLGATAAAARRGAVLVKPGRGDGATS